MTPTQPLSCWAVTAPGLESLAVHELRQWGATTGEEEPGGVTFTATPDQLADALLQVRTITRLTVRMASFSARTFGELERHAVHVDWAAVLPPGLAVHFSVVSKKSRLYHQDAIAERLTKSLLAAVPDAVVVKSATEAELLESDLTRLPGVQRILVRLWRDEVTISADASGALLHRRGWRQFTGKAPLRETLAAAMLIGANWDGAIPLYDPFAGSGTIVIEAATLARRMGPGRGRRFALEQWPSVAPDVVAKARVRATALELPAVAVSLVGADRDAGAMAGAMENAQRAGVGGDVHFERATIAMMPQDAGEGLLLTNPPYGVRVGQRNTLRDLYATLGAVAAVQRPHWRMALLSADPMLIGQLHRDFEERWRTVNGGIGVKLLNQRREE